MQYEYIMDSGREILRRFTASHTTNLREECRHCNYVKFMDYLYGDGIMKREDTMRRMNHAV